MAVREEVVCLGLEVKGEREAADKTLEEQGVKAGEVF
jgi:hypothetical protein